MAECDYSKTWYHGSPLRLTTIRRGSTITQDRDLARVFSHKPTLVSISDDEKIKHNGRAPSFLYCVAEDIRPTDVYPHPRSSMEYGKEWLTNRDLRVTLIGPTKIVEKEMLTEEEVEELWRKARLREKRRKPTRSHKS